ncbi:MAG TPA: carbohydrate ABC transporter permease, partial [Caldilineaceae bacterium]|nr:carbohydrate ABC transporter permease [Caldilineaceae bacterium]
RELYDAAKIDGSGDFAIYRNIILPLTKPVLSALAIFTFLGSFNAYLWPLVVLNDEDKLTLPLIIARMANRFGGTDYQAVMAGSVLVSIPPLLVFLFFQRNFVRGIALTGLKG